MAHLAGLWHVMHEYVVAARGNRVETQDVASHMLRPHDVLFFPCHVSDAIINKTGQKLLEAWFWRPALFCHGDPAVVS